MHRLLKRQIKKHLRGESNSPELTHFIDAINAAYIANDQDVTLIERSLELTSAELTERNESLRKQVKKQKEFQAILGHSLSTLNATFDATGEAIMAIDANGAIVKHNKMAEVLIKSLNKEYTTGSVIQFKFLLSKVVNPSTFFNKLRRIKLHPQNDFFGQIHTIDNRTFEYHCSPQLKNNELLGRVWCFRDITELKKNEAMITHQAFHDILTGLPNRTLLNDRVEHAINYSKRFNTQLAMLFIDLDDFKKVNDNAGHHAGDRVLIEVTQRLQRCIREVDTLARLGGDEFVVLLENLNNNDISSKISKRIINELSKPFKIADNTYFISSSIGISNYPKDSQTTDELIRKADMAMYHAKSVGKGNYQYFNAELEHSSNKRLEIENRLRKAITNNEFTLVFQPKIDLVTNSVDSVEALIRWQQKDGSYITPDEFIPIAEQTGLINEIGSWVLNEACSTLASLLKQGLPILPIAINVSPIEFKNKTLFSQFKTILEQYNLPPSTIEAEITESLFLEDINNVKKTLTELRKIGVTVAVDDFGTGFSSLQYLHELPIDVIKIDRSFVMNIEEKQHNAAITDTIITLARNLNLKVVAEGVESEGALRFLQARQCDLAQGYYFYKPLSKQQLINLIKKQHV
jgi:diguanylate cyclase (GGDEF)-like protein